MKAMIFAAGLGTRLRPLTDAKPKALVEIDGVTLLEGVVLRLREAGVTEVIINVHHLPGQIEEHVAQHDGWGLRVVFSKEEELLDTGGGLNQASWFFDDGRPFLVHNVDVLSDIDLVEMLRAHEKTGALVTLAAKPRRTARPLVFDLTGQLCGRADRSGAHLVRPPNLGVSVLLGFCGIHVVSPGLFRHLTRRGRFSVIDAYLKVAAAGLPVRVFRVDRCRWRDAGQPENLRPL